MTSPDIAKELTIERSIFNEAWSIIKDYHHIEAWGNDKYWDQVVDRAVKLYELGIVNGKPELEKLSKDMSLTVLTYLDTISKDKGDKENAQRTKEREEALKKQLKSI